MFVYFFLSTFRFSTRTPKISRILTLYQANAAILMPLRKKDKILIKNLSVRNVKFTMLGSL